jgi:hypothetical protein
MTCNLCSGDKPFTVPCGDGIGEALMADHMASEHDEYEPARKLRAHHLRTRRITSDG